MIVDRELIAPDEVLRELEKKEGDALHQWAKGNAALFQPLDADVQRATTEILTAFPRLVDSRRDRSMADPFVIALAKVRACTVVTGERNAGTNERPRIPNVCGSLSIRCIGLLGLMRDKKWTFV